MKWSWKIARVSGIDIYLHVTFLLLIFIVGVSYWNQQGTIAAVITGIGYILALFLCVVLHEFGHSLMARRYGIQTRRITLLPIGGVASLEKMPDDPRQEINVAIAGPAVNFGIALLLFLYLYLSNLSGSAAELSLTGDTFVHRLMAVNLFIGIFNLLPAFPMDGGRVLRAAMALRMDHAKATRKAARVGQFLAVGMGLLGIFYNPFLMFIAIFIWFGASAEYKQEQLQRNHGRMNIRQVMLTSFHTLSPKDTLAKAIELTLISMQADFPVQGRSGGPKVLHHEDLMKSLQIHEEHTLLSSLELPELPCIDINAPSGSLIEQLQKQSTRLIGVIEAGKLVGLLSSRNSMEMLEIQQTLLNRKLPREN